MKFMLNSYDEVISMRTSGKSNEKLFLMWKSESNFALSSYIIHVDYNTKINLNENG